MKDEGMDYRGLTDAEVQERIEKGQIRGYFKQMVRKERKQDTWKQRKNYLRMQA